MMLLDYYIHSKRILYVKLLMHIVNKNQFMHKRYNCTIMTLNCEYIEIFNEEYRVSAKYSGFIVSSRDKTLNLN